jgi:hypothetical protein
MINPSSLRSVPAPRKRQRHPKGEDVQKTSACNDAPRPISGSHRVATFLAKDKPIRQIPKFDGAPFSLPTRALPVIEVVPPQTLLQPDSTANQSNRSQLQTQDSDILASSLSFPFTFHAEPTPSANPLCDTFITEPIDHNGDLLAVILGTDDSNLWSSAPSTFKSGFSLF